MKRAERIELANSLKEKFSKAQLAVFADYKGVKAADADNLRKKLREKGAEAKVIKNNLARKAAEDGSLGEGTKEVLEGLVGPTLVAFAYEDVAATAKVVHEYSKENEALEVKDSVMEGKKITVQEVSDLASLPSREVLLGKLLGQLNAPAQSFVGVLSALPRNLVQVLSAIEQKKKESGES